MPTEQPVRYNNPKNANDVITSTMTHPEAAEVCRRVPPQMNQSRTGNFCRDLSNRVLNNQPMSQAQLFWLHKLALEQLDREKPKDAIQVSGWSFGPMTTITEFLNPASLSLKSGATVTFRSAMPEIGMSNDGTVQIKRARANSRYPGQYFVTDGVGFPRGMIYGRILTDSMFVPHKETDPMPHAGVLALLDEFQAEPRRFVQQYGIKTGRCCFCDLPLEDPNSTRLGYGPVCAKHYKMPHGKKAVEALDNGKPLGEQKEAPAGGLFASDLQWTPGEAWPTGFAHKGLWYGVLSMQRDGEGDLQSAKYGTPDGLHHLTVFND